MRIVLCLLLAVDTGEPDPIVSCSAAALSPPDLAGALYSAGGIVKGVLLTAVGDFYGPDPETGPDARRIPASWTKDGLDERRNGDHT
ncbi:hypothetical protein [Streptomyces cellulosae]|uniref:Uncharacterized protein n=1 Tax=Streptomyces cellulosae TaxID=1968 RepID=A0ABW7XXK1_STRCE